jgi:adenylate cyclase 3
LDCALARLLSLLQVVESTKIILERFGFAFEPRGMVSVKGKGQLMTYFLKGKLGDDVTELANQSCLFKSL